MRGRILTGPALLLVLLLAACGGGAVEPTQPPAVPPAVPTETAASIAEATPEPALPTSGPAPTAFLPPPGVLGGAVVTEEAAPEDTAGLEQVAPPSGFDEISFVQTGGPANESLQIEVRRSTGEVLVNGEAVPVEAARLDALAAYIDEISLFDVQGVFLGPAARPNDYRYRLIVSSGQNARSFEMQEGYLPPEITRLLALILDLQR